MVMSFPCPNRQFFSTFVDVLRYRAAEQPDDMAFDFLKDDQIAEHWTYLSLTRAALAVAAKLQSLHLAGARALLLYPPGSMFIPAFLGCLCSSVIAVPAYPPRPNQKLERLQAIIRDAQALVVLTTASQLREIQKRFSEFPVLRDELQWLATDEVGSDWRTQWCPPSLTSESMAFLQYTSGSTGTPKGVMVTHGNLLHNLEVIRQTLGTTQATRIVSWLPVFHDMGLVGNVLHPLYVGCPATLLSPVEFLRYPVRWLQAITTYRGTVSGGPNFAYDLCVQRVKDKDLAALDLRTWDIAFNGAEPVRASTLESFLERFGPCGFQHSAFYSCYGMAETTLLVTGGSKEKVPTVKGVDKTALEQNRVVTIQVQENAPDLRAAKLVSCGYPGLDLEVRIVDPATCEPLEEGAVGEIWVSGKSVAAGYWNRPQETQEIFKARLADTLKGIGGVFLRTGDLGCLLQGELFITGRIKDIIIIRGKNYYPQDIELTLEQSHPALQPNSCAAFTIEVKEEPRLVIVQEVKRSYLRSLDVREVIGNIRQAIASQHALESPHAIVLVRPGQVPKTSSGKVRRYACRNAFRQGLLKLALPQNE